MKRLFVLYDANCGLCSRIRRWAEGQPAFVELEFIAAGSSRAARWFPSLVRADHLEELLVVSDDGAVYAGDTSWIMVLYALEAYREWAIRLSRPWLLPHARVAFKVLSDNRKRVSSFLGLVSDRDLVDLLRDQPAPGCAVGEPT